MALENPTTNRQRRLLAVTAHPDDECFGVGGTLAHYAASGVDVFLVCATRGEVGEISDASLATPETLGQVREQELRSSCRVLGIHEPIFFDYRDSGMAGTPDNQHPASLNMADSEEVVARLTALIRELRPEVVLTFDSNGGYGHPDHIAVHRHTGAAIAAASQGEASPRLYYFAIPRSLFRTLVSHTPPDSPFHRRDPESMGTPDEAITAQINVSAYVDVKLQAMACHRTQMNPDGPFAHMPKEEVSRFFATEHFIQALPPFQSSERQRDLFP